MGVSLSYVFNCFSNISNSTHLQEKLNEDRHLESLQHAAGVFSPTASFSTSQDFISSSSWHQLLGQQCTHHYTLISTYLFYWHSTPSLVNDNFPSKPFSTQDFATPSPMTLSTQHMTSPPPVLPTQSMSKHKVSLHASPLILSHQKMTPSPPTLSIQKMIPSPPALLQEMTPSPLTRGGSRLIERGGQKWTEALHCLWFDKVRPKKKRSQPADNSCPPHQPHIYSW